MYMLSKIIDTYQLVCVCACVHTHTHTHTHTLISACSLVLLHNSVARSHFSAFQLTESERIMRTSQHSVCMCV